MLMMCWFYCIPFAKGFFFALSFLLIVFSLFMLKRGIYQARPMLRQAAFLLMFIAALKLLTIDLHLLKEKILCGTGWFSGVCNAQGFKVLQVTGLAALMLCSLGLFNLYRNFIHERKAAHKTPGQIHLPFWANTAMGLVTLLILWLAAPWVGYLTVGHVPQLFMQVPWQHLAVMTVVVLVVGFWKLEDCKWVYTPDERTKKAHVTHVWTPKDTLWLSAILFLIALAFSYASNDALSAGVSEGGGHLQMDDFDFGFLWQGFQRPNEY